MAIDIKDLGRELLAIVKSAGKIETMKVVAKKGKELITKRTQSGLDKTGKSLPPLEPSTKRIRSKKTLASTTSAGTSNVTRSGKMIKSMRASGKSKEATIEFKNAESQRKVNALQSVSSKSGTKSFDFFGLTNGEEKKLIDEIESAVEVAVDKFNQK